MTELCEPIYSLDNQTIYHGDRWELKHRMQFHPDMMRFRETTGGESDPMIRAIRVKCRR